MASQKLVKRVLFIVTIFTFLINSFGILPVARADEFHLPAPGLMVHLSSNFTPAQLVGMTIHPDNALHFDFLINRGERLLNENQKKEEYAKLVRYFLTSLTIPDEDQWVNLSPYEKKHIIKDDFGNTSMGRDLLAQDYILKQMTSSLIYPEEKLGKKFWDKVYERAWKEYGSTEVPINTFNKVWIIPDEAVIYESGNTAYILRNHLKVMVEEDYLSLKKHDGISGNNQPLVFQKTHALGSQIVKEIILPELEKEVNEGSNFASLRQVYSGMVLAAWYKKVFRASLLGQIYANKAKIKGVDQDPRINELIYQKYLKAFKRGVFNYIKDDVDKYTHQLIPRKYFSGGTTAYIRGAVLNADQLVPGRVQYYRGPLPKSVSSRVDFATLSKNALNTDQVAIVLSPQGANVSQAPHFTSLPEKVILTGGHARFFSSNIGDIFVGVGVDNEQNGYVLSLEVSRGLSSGIRIPVYLPGAGEDSYYWVHLVAENIDSKLRDWFSDQKAIPEHGWDLRVNKILEEQMAKMGVVINGKVYPIPVAKLYWYKLLNFRAESQLQASKSLISAYAALIANPNTVSQPQLQILESFGLASSHRVLPIVSDLIETSRRGDTVVLPDQISSVLFTPAIAQGIQNTKELIYDLTRADAPFLDILTNIIHESGIWFYDDHVSYSIVNKLAPIIEERYGLNLFRNRVGSDYDNQREEPIEGFISVGTDRKIKINNQKARIFLRQLASRFRRLSFETFEEMTPNLERVFWNNAYIFIYRLLEEQQRYIKRMEETLGRLNQQGLAEDQFKIEFHKKLEMILPDYSYMEKYMLRDEEEGRIIYKKGNEFVLDHKAVHQFLFNLAVQVFERFLTFDRSDGGLNRKWDNLAEVLMGSWESGYEVALSERGKVDREEKLKKLAMSIDFYTSMPSWQRSVDTRIQERVRIIRNALTKKGIIAPLEKWTKNGKENPGLPSGKNPAMASKINYGGIDFNASHLNLQIKSDGRGVPLPLARQDMAMLNQIQGFVPVIINIQPMRDVKGFLKVIRFK